MRKQSKIKAASSAAESEKISLYNPADLTYASSYPDTGKRFFYQTGGGFYREISVIMAHAPLGK